MILIKSIGLKLLHEVKLHWQSLFLIAPFFLWGTSMVAMKGVIPHTTPLFMAGLRIVPAGVLLVLVALLKGRSHPQGWQAWLWIGIFALVDGSLFQGFLGEGLMRTGAGLGSVMIDSQPLAVAILSSWLFGDRIGLWGWLGLGIGILGISLIGVPDAWLISLAQGNFQQISGDISQLFQSGELLMLMAALSMAVGTVLVKWVCRYVDPVMATGWHLILGGLPLFGLSVLGENNQLVNITGLDWLAMLYAAIFGSAIAYGLFFYFAAQGNLTSLSALTFLTPVFALLFGNLILGEILSPIQSGGVILTLVSIYLINQRENLSKKWQGDATKSVA